MTVDVEERHTLLVEGLAFPESPRWHADKLWFVDMHAHTVGTVGLDGVRATIGEFDDRPSAIGFLPNGTPIVVLARKRLLVQLTPPEFPVYADLTDVPGDDFNDMVVDGAGRAYIGNRVRDVPASDSLVLVTPTGDRRIVATGLDSPNGAVVTPDGKTLIVADSRRHRLLKFDISDDGNLTNQREFARTTHAEHPVSGRDAAPDGICLDSHGGIWLGSHRTHEFLRVTEGGTVTHRLRLGENERAIACTLGGPDRRSLFLVIAETTEENIRACRVSPEAERRSSSKGWIKMVSVELPGVGWP